MGVTVERHGPVDGLVASAHYDIAALVVDLDAGLAARTAETRPLPLVLDVRRSDSVLERSVGDPKKVAQHFMPNAGPFGQRIAIVVSEKARYGLMRMAGAWLAPENVETHFAEDLEDRIHWALMVAGLETAE